MPKKRIGIVGGLGPEATIVYYSTIISGYRSITGSEDYPEVIIYSLCFECFRGAVRRGDSGAAVSMLLNALESLHRAGADLALIAANTPHMFYDVLAEKSAIPLIDIVEPLADALARDGVKRVGLLATKKTIETGFYAKRLEAKGFTVLVPSKPVVEEVNTVIFRDLAVGRVTDAARSTVEKAVRELAEKGAEAVALACTELSLLVSREKEIIQGVPVYDTARLHALYALKEALREA